VFPHPPATDRRPESAGQSMGEVTHVVESIKRHLLRLLDFNDATLGTHDLSVQTRGAIRQCIEKFEPRVRRVDVVNLPQGPDPLQLRFQVTVYLRVGSEDDKTPLICYWTTSATTE